ncbi:MAG: hypothetical protein H8E28_04925 [Anaerolineae bacterium]|nr:hypothetical protein [Anaerolineae bacterium]
MSQNTTSRKDVQVLWGGILLSLLFSGMIWLAGSRLDAVRLLPDQGVSWYYWKLPEPTFWTHLSAWGLYLLHQFSFWYLIFQAQSQKTKYSTTLHRWNWAALAVNVLFIVLHFVQTHWLYDGLAQDVSIWSSQASVAVLLIWVLLMENNRRGLFFGKKLSFRQETIRFARKYHGYFFAWATVYTFWYHPMVFTSGHLMGFFYMFLLLLQGSLFFTRVHTNRWWTLFQEVGVLVHGTLVAVMQGNNLWPMFAFGFGGVLVITQMHGLKLSRRVRWGIGLAYIVSAIWVYSGRGWLALNEIVRIPLIDYLAVGLLAGIFTLGLRVADRFRHAV